MAKYHAVLYMCNDLPRAELVIQGMKEHNPHIPLTVYNGGSDVGFLRNKYNIELIQGPNLWHKRTRHPPGSFSYEWVVSLFDFAEKYDPDYLIFLETDVKVNRKIDKEPLYDLSGPISGCGYMEELVMYDFWGNFIREQPFEEDKSSKWPHKFHTAMGATAFSRNFFNTCREKLPYVKLCYDTIPLNCYQDVLISCFARSFGCTLGDWSEASDTRGMPRYVNSEWIYTPVDMNCALVHNYKI